MSIRIALADDRAEVLDGLEGLLGAELDLEVVARSSDGREALKAVEELVPDVLILDLRMPRMSGAEVLRAIEARGIKTRVIVLTAFAREDEIFDAIKHGARGVMFKELASRFLIECVRKIHAGDRWLERRTFSRAMDRLLSRESDTSASRAPLTERELEIVRLVGLGLRNRQIAERLLIEEGTVKVHLHNIYRKLEVDGRLALLRLADDRGWV